MGKWTAELTAQKGHSTTTTLLKGLFVLRTVLSRTILMLQLTTAEGATVLVRVVKEERKQTALLVIVQGLFRSLQMLESAEASVLRSPMFTPLTEKISALLLALLGPLA